MRGHNVYFIRPIGMPGAPIKIGFTWNIKLRMETFAVWSPYPLEVLASGEGGRAIENRLHKFFAADRLHFEWFTPTARLRSFVADVNTLGLDAAMIEHGVPLLPPHILKLRKAA